MSKLKELEGVLEKLAVEIVASDSEPMDGDETSDIADRFLAFLDYHSGNITEAELETLRMEAKDV